MRAALSPRLGDQPLPHQHRHRKLARMHSRVFRNVPTMHASHTGYIVLIADSRQEMSLETGIDPVARLFRSTGRFGKRSQSAKGHFFNETFVC